MANDWQESQNELSLKIHRLAKVNVDLADAIAELARRVDAGLLDTDHLNDLSAFYGSIRHRLDQIAADVEKIDKEFRKLMKL